MKKKLFALIFLTSFLFPQLSLAQSNYSTPKLNTSQAIETLNSFLGVPYRDDGALNLKGENTLFANPSARFDSPGLNCSGFVLSAARAILNKPISIEDAKLDRLEDSGPGSRYGEDWDFGWDLILNISEGFERYYLNPNGTKPDPTRLNGFDARGYDFHATGALEKLLSRLEKNRLYLLSFNRDTKARGYKLMHYHVGLIMLDNNGDALMYQTTTQSRKVYKRNISKPKEKNDFLRAFANTGGVKKHMAVIEVILE